MNKKIAVLTFAIFAVSFENMQASVGGYNVDTVIQTIQEIKSMNPGANRSGTLSNLSYGSTTPGYVYHPQDSKSMLRDVLRNQPEYGGSANALEEARQIASYHAGTPSVYASYYASYYEMMVAFAQFKQQHLK